MGAVNTISYAAATANGNQRKIDRCQNGVLWAFYNNAVGNAVLGYIVYSTDGGATWSTPLAVPNGSGTSSSNYQQNASFFIDVDDYAHLAFKDNNNGYLYYTRGTPNAARTAYTWSTATALENSDQTYDVPDIVAFRDPANAGAWVAHAVYCTTVTTNIKTFTRRINITSGGTITVSAATTLSAAAPGTNSLSAYPSIDFNHTGDGKTVAGGTPHLYVAWSNGATGAGYGIRFRKATYASGSWTWGTEREIDNTRYIAGSTIYWLNCLYDGTRAVITGCLNTGSLTNTVIYDRDAADTTTTTRVLLGTASTDSAAADYLAGGSSTYDAAGNVYLFGADGTGGNGTRKVNYRRWVRSTTALDALVTFDATGPNAPYVSARRGYQGQAIDYVYTDGTASPYTVTSGRITLNQPPTAPTNITPADGTTYDSSADRTVTFTHNDPDGDAASSYRLRYRPAGITTTYAYLTGTTTTANGATVSVTVPAGTWAGQVTFAAETYDASGTEGAWSSNVTITGIPSALAAATGGQGGTAAPALSLYNQFRAEQAARTSGRSALATVASLSPLQITVDGSTVNATRNAGYTPVLNDLVDVGLINDTWVIRDRVV